LKYNLVAKVADYQQNKRETERERERCSIGSYIITCVGGYPKNRMDPRTRERHKAVNTFRSSNKAGD
jgi:sulfatase maturation enzyme AslB (radical SAM superfamily)